MTTVISLARRNFTAVAAHSVPPTTLGFDGKLVKAAINGEIMIKRLENHCGSQYSEIEHRATALDLHLRKSAKLQLDTTPEFKQ